MFDRALRKSLIFGALLTTLHSCKTLLREGHEVSIGSQYTNKYWIPDGVTVKDNLITMEGKNSRLSSRFSLRNFVLTMKLKTTGGAEGILQFHTPAGGSNLMQGYKVIINNSDYRKGNLQKTGSLSMIRNNFVRTSADDAWFELQITVKANHIMVAVNKKPVSEYIEPENPKRLKGLEGLILSSGYLVLQKTNDAGNILADRIDMERLADDIAREAPDPSTMDKEGEDLNLLNQRGFPLIDFHGHLKGGLTVEQVCRHGRIHGYNFGISPNCGLNFPVTNDSSLVAYFNSMKAEPVFKAMQCEGREWIKLFTPAAISNFDYIFTDAMTWTDQKGRRMRLWIPAETFVDDEQQFMDMLVGKIEAILYQEPVDVHVNPTYLPAVISADYDRLWTHERMDRVIKALKDNDVALEINARFRIPSIDFIKRAKAAGVKFSFGTNNADNTDLNRLEYCVKAIEEAGLTPEDIFLPRPSGDKKVLKKGLPVKITG
jgi:hypothetical protein